jgi:hypothetical protein
MAYKQNCEHINPTLLVKVMDCRYVGATFHWFFFQISFLFPHPSPVNFYLNEDKRAFSGRVSCARPTSPPHELAAAPFPRPWPPPRTCPPRPGASRSRSYTGRDPDSRTAPPRRREALDCEGMWGREGVHRVVHGLEKGGSRVGSGCARRREVRCSSSTLRTKGDWSVLVDAVCHFLIGAWTFHLSNFLFSGEGSTWLTGLRRLPSRVLLLSCIHLPTGS